MTPRPLLAAALLPGLLTFLALGSAQAAELVVAPRGAAYTDLMRDAYVQPFARAGAAGAEARAWPGGLGALRAMLDGDAPPDVVQVDGDELGSGCAAGWFLKLDWSRLPGRDHYLPAAATDCGVGAVLVDDVLAWDRDKFPTVPSWGDFWDVAKIPGKRGLRRGAKGNLEIALLADGVPPSDVYATLRTEDGVDRAFRKLDQLKPYLAWWRSGAEAARMLGSGEVLMTSAPNTAIADANMAGHRFGIQWAGSLGRLESWAIPRGSHQPDAAYGFLALAGDPKQQERLIAQIPYGGTARGAGALLPPEAQGSSPAGPANLDAALPIDEGFWRANLDALNARFDAWIAR